MTIPGRAECFAWVAFSAAGAIWMLALYPRHWYFSDEWTLIGRSLESGFNLFDGYQGHLAVETHLAYRVQTQVLGLGGHALIWGALCVSLVAFQLGVALVLRRLGLPALIALLAATVIAYFGPGAESVVSEFQQGLNLALALSFFAAFLALSDDKRPARAGGIAALLLASFALDSGVAILGLVYVGVLVGMLWPRRLAVRALAVPTVAHIAWLAFGEPVSYVGTSLSTMWKFASRLFLISASGLVGGGETESHFAGLPSSPAIPIDGATVGLLVLVLAIAGVGVGLARHRLDRRVIASLIGGLVAALAGATSLARTRAFLTGPDELPGLRYLQWVAVFQLLAFAPAIAASVRPTSRRAAHVMASVATLALSVVFVLNMGQLRPVQRVFEHFGMTVRANVGEVMDVLATGCPAGREPAPQAKVSPELSPQITVALVEQLVAEGALPASFRHPATREVRDRVCR